MKESIIYGGDWTVKKLAVLQSYLQAYLKALNERVCYI